MGIDIYHSRRINFTKCLYYKRNESINDLSKYVLLEKPEGHFYARLYSPNSRQNQDIANTFRFSENSLTLVTEDDVDELKENNIVLYNGKAYVVMGVQRELHLKESQYSGEHYTTYISLRK